LHHEQADEQAEARNDETERDDREAGAKPRQERALGSKEHARVGVGYWHGLVSSAPEFTGLARRCASRWIGAAPAPDGQLKLCFPFALSHAAVRSRTPLASFHTSRLSL
jgi:hypothetical protein